MIALLPLALVLLSICVYFYYLRWRDRWVRSQPFPAQWQGFLTTALPVYSSLSEQEQLRLRQLMLLFLAKKHFYGCAGIVVTDEMRVTIAAEACLLLLNKGWSVYPSLQSILVYPSVFQVDRQVRREDGTVASEGRHVLGESWENGKVVLSWDDVEHGVADFSDGHNVVLHEFAHQLDAASGATNGAPPLRRNSYRSWARVFADNFENLRLRSRKRQKTVMDKYGGSSPAEFFAVATETFFEKPRQLHQKRPELYRELSRYYQLDPRLWQDQPGDEGNGSGSKVPPT